MGMYVYINRDTGAQSTMEDDVFCDGTPFQAIKWGGAIAQSANGLGHEYYYSEPGCVVVGADGLLIILETAIHYEQSDVDKLKIQLLMLWIQQADYDEKLVFA